MERFNKRIILIILLIGIFLLTGCSKLKNVFDASKEDDTKTVTVVPDKNTGETTANNKKNNSQDNNASMPTKAAEALAVTELPIYTVGSEGELEPVTALVQDGSTITPELIVDKVIEALSDESIDLVKDSVSTQKDKVIVSFKKDKAPYSDTTSEEMEGNILNAFAQSLIDNLKDSGYNKVIFRIEGKAYTSDAFELGIDEPYMQN